LILSISHKNGIVGYGEVGAVLPAARLLKGVAAKRSWSTFKVGRNYMNDTCAYTHAAAKGKKNEDDKKFVAQLDGLARCFKGLNT
jgi:hypothetical protein